MKLGKIALMGMAAVMAAFTVREWPELVRYLKMKSM